MSNAGETIGNTLKDYADKQTSANLKAVGVQVALMTGISLAVMLAFSFFRPREKKIYAPKVKYRSPTDEDEPPPTISNGFFSWLYPLLTKDDVKLVDTVGLDAVAFLTFLTLLRWFFLACSVLVCGVLIPINVIYTRQVQTKKTTPLSMMTLSQLSGNVVFVHLAMTYVITFVLLFFVWFYWKKMLALRKNWFMSKKYQRSIQSRSLMVTNIKKEYQSDEGLRTLMQKIRGGNEKIAVSIQSTMIGRDLKDYPALIEDYNETVADFEAVLVKYLKGGIEAKSRPMIRRGGFLGMGGTKIDAIEFYGTKLSRLREILDAKKQDIDLLKPKHSKRHDPNASAKKQAKHIKIPAENYGFVSMMDASQAHAIAKAHQGRQKELFGAEIKLAPAPPDIIWKNANISPSERANSKFVGACLLVLLCIFNTVPLFLVAGLANLPQLSSSVAFLGDWKSAGQWGEWTFSTVAGVLPPIVSAVFGLLLPWMIRRLTKYQGATSRSETDRTVLTRLFAFLVISQFIVFSLLSVVITLIFSIVDDIKAKKGTSAILSNLSGLPWSIQHAYVNNNAYWLTWFPLRGFLAFFELAQLIKLVLLSVKTLLFAKTPRDIQDWTRPPNFQFPVVYANLLFLAAVALMYAPLAPLVTLFGTIVFWISHYIYKYQLLYVYGARVESGGRMWNVAVNRLLVCCMLMQLLMILTITLLRLSWKDAVASAPPLLVTLVFKLFVLRPYGDQFLYFTPTPEEAQDLVREATYSYKQRFIHPALRDDTLHTVMVHKDQQDLVRQILAPYSRKLQEDVTGIRENDLTEYDPENDPERHQEKLLAEDASRFGDADSTFRTHLPPGLSRGYSDSASTVLDDNGAGGYVAHERNESTAHLVSSGAPYGGYPDQSYNSTNNLSGYHDPYSNPSLPLDRQQTSSPSHHYAEYSSEHIPMANLASNSRSRPVSPALRSPQGYGVVPTHSVDDYASPAAQVYEEQRDHQGGYDQGGYDQESYGRNGVGGGRY